MDKEAIDRDNKAQEYYIIERGKYRERYVIRYSLHIARSSDKGSFPSSKYPPYREFGCLPTNVGTRTIIEKLPARKSPCNKEGSS